MSFGAVAAIGGAVIAADAAGNAADKQAGAAAGATAAQRAAADRAYQLQEPYQEAGNLANNKLLSLLGLQSESDSAALSSAFDSIYRQERALADQKHRESRGFGFDDAPAWAQAELSNWDQQIRNEAKKRAQAQVKAGGGTGSTESGFGSLMKKFGMEDFEADPGYKFRMDEGMKGVERSAASRGGLFSGAAGKQLERFGQGLASQEYGNAYNRFTNDQTNQYNKLAGVVNSGQGAANQIGNAQLNFGNQQANNMIGAGNAQAAAGIAQGNAWQSGINDAFNLYNQSNALNKALNSGGSSGGFGTGNLYGNQDLGNYF